MQALKDKIRSEGKIINQTILKVDSFLNHQLDVAFLVEVGQAFKELFSDKEVTKILTTEVSGIAIATCAALHFNVPVVFAKKTVSATLDDSVYEGHVYSYTKKTHYTIRVSKTFLSPDDKVLILDDFLANGEALKGMKDIIETSQATCVGAGVVIEKCFQDGGHKLRAEGLDVRSLVGITSMKDGHIEFK